MTVKKILKNKYVGGTIVLGGMALLASFFSSILLIVGGIIGCSFLVKKWFK